MKFKPKDLVICIDSSGVEDLLEKNNIYTVRKEYENKKSDIFVNLEEFEGYSGFFIRRFVLATEAAKILYGKK